MRQRAGDRDPAPATWLAAAPDDVAANLALDEALLEEAHEGIATGVVVRTWMAAAPTVVLGSSSRTGEEIDLAACERLAPGVDFVMEGPGVIALDGDRLHALAEGERAVLRVARDGPPVIDVARCIGWAAARGLLGREGAAPRPAHDAPGPAP